MAETASSCIGYGVGDGNRVLMTEWLIQRRRNAGRWLAGLLLALSFVLVPAAHADVPVAQGQEQELVPPQARGEWRFDGDGVAFDNVAEGARLAGVVRLDRGSYRLVVRPETIPVNPSPWYAFRIIASRPGSAAMVFDYGRFSHRYRPWLRRSGSGGRAGDWRPATDAEFATDDDGVARLSLRLEAGDLVEVSAQPPVRMAAVERWVDALAQRMAAEVETSGHSVQGRPLRLLAFGNPDARDVVLVIGRQHPPEVTGMRALLAFVDALAADAPHARAFRARYRILVVPQLNPDGVVEGHWRTNAHGTDLNRDWGIFREPETRAVADALQRHLEARGRTLVFALDFHSTWYDIFYTVTEDPARLPGGVLRNWMDALDARFPGRIQERPSAATSNVFKNWVFREYGAPSVTYEVGDETDVATLSELAGFAAGSLMELLPADRQAGAR